MSTAAIVLAAGGSSRMGGAKQLLEFRGETLVRRAAREAVAAGLGPVVVVTGAGAEEVSAAVGGLGVRIVHNARWQEGMGTSIATGVEAVSHVAGVTGVLILLADQPLVDGAVLAELERAGRGMDAAACWYASGVGVPAWFARRLFARLTGLESGAGAKHVLMDAQLRVAAIEFADAEIDIDTPDDYRRLVKRMEVTGGGA